MDLQTNPQLELAFEFVRNTNKSLFLTGKAGSGKTTFLHQIRNGGTKRLVVVAPTGVAAINAGGMTIHSLFQLPFGLHLPDMQRGGGERQFKFSRSKVRLIRSLDLLVIDEISMVRADLMDAVDEVMRRFRGQGRPFGGAQLLMIGDLHQLPPVVKPEEWEILARCYETPYFFSSRALQQTDYIVIELKHIYRQSDPEFIGLLNKVRDNRLDEESFRKLNSRFIAGFRPEENEAYITLTATNAVANEINARNLAQLAGKPHLFEARIEGEFPPGSYPTEASLKFKVGAQVMFIKNDTQSEHRKYFNGKIGRITRIAAGAIGVRCPGERSEIDVVPAEWQNVKYSLNEETKQIDELVLGTFTQIPLKLAWAITIHKSQGLTFERAIIDAQAAFAAGQVYVALSRCKSFEGIVLRSRIGSSNIKTDPLVTDFCEQAGQNLPTEYHLRHARIEFQSSTLRELFSFDALQEQLEQLRSTYSQHRKSLPLQSMDLMHMLAERAAADLFDVSRNFAPQLAEYLNQPSVPQENESLQVRVRKAATYFTEKISGILQELSKLSAVSDNQEVSAALASRLREIQLGLFVKRGTFAACSDRFDAGAYYRAKVDSELEFSKNIASVSPKQMLVPQDVPHPVLYRQLLEWRERTAKQVGIALSDVLPASSLRELVSFLPTDKTQLRLIDGIGKNRLRRYGTELCELIQSYRTRQQVPTTKSTPAASQVDGSPDEPREIAPISSIDNEPATENQSPVRTEGKQSSASETKRRSFELFRTGKSIDEIATERQLARSTIEGHLAHFIGRGELDVYSVLDQQSVETIQRFFLTHSDVTSAEAKSHFGDKYSYGELKMVINHIKLNLQ